MTRTKLICSTPLAKINALAYQGIRPVECYAQILDTLKRNLGESYESSLAEPVLNRDEGFIDWYAPCAGEVKPLALMPNSAKEALIAKLNQEAKQIKDYAESLIASGDPKQVTRGNLLKLSLCYPTEEDLLVVGERLFVTCWGFGPGSQGAMGLNLCDLRYFEPIKHEKVQKEPVKSSLGLAWLWPFLLLLLLLLLLFADFGRQKALLGLSLLSLPGFSGENLKDKELAIEALEAEISELTPKLLGHLASCPSKLPPPKPLEPSVKREELVIPENVKDTSFLKGRWLCATGLYNSRTKQPVQVEFIFDDNGEGLGRVYEPNDRCTGRAKAELKGEILQIEHDVLQCEKNNSRYNRNTIACTKAEGKTQCLGQTADGSTWRAVFLKLQGEVEP
ncbi:MAG: hypothetical protein IJS50_03340 [Desulfovibrio sp.]|nr:hypothetical protein [Desulfovibrio sp.]